jgi:pimeloyl-ACP methyl ester carboxylesterase
MPFFTNDKLSVMLSANSCLANRPATSSLLCVASLEMQQREFKVADRTISALLWGESDGLPVLALHGWMDNAQSFSVLAPQLSGCQVLAPDLAGHGHSDHRSADGEYNLWSDLPDLLALAKEMGWKKFLVLGHSRGALIARLLAAALPDTISALVLLDAFAPASSSADDCPQQLAAYLRDRRRLHGRKIGVFKSTEQAIAVRVDKGMARVAAEPIVMRNLEPCATGWRWRMDARLAGSSVFKMTEDHNRAINRRLTMPVHLLTGRDGYGSYLVSPELQQYGIIVEQLEGGHHFHMESASETVARRILELLNPLQESQCAHT